eukprot:PhF_6_TR36519/c0_g1_i1/m.53799
MDGVVAGTRGSVQTTMALDQYDSGFNRICISSQHQRRLEDRKTSSIERKLKTFTFTKIKDQPKQYFYTLMFLALLELTSVVVYIIEAEQVWDYLEENDENDLNQHPKHDWINGYQAALAFIFTVHLIVGVVLEGFSTAVLTNKYMGLAILTCIPMNVVTIGMFVHYDTWKSVWLPFFLRIWCMRRNIKAAMTVKDFGFNPLTRDMINAINTVVCVLVTAASAFQASEGFSNRQEYWWDAFYYVIVTFSTVGYGDVLPNADATKVLTMATIVVAVAFFPNMISKAADFVQIRKRFARFTPIPGTKHVIVGGVISVDTIEMVMFEFTSGSRKHIPIIVVFVSAEPFADECHVLKRRPMYANRVVFLVGDIADPETLERAAFSQADAVMFLTDFGLPKSECDWEILRRAWNATYYDVNVPPYVSLRHTTSMSYLNEKFMICLNDELRYSLLGQAVKNPGIIPLVVNLLQSYEADQLGFRKDKYPWINEYKHSRDNELYSTSCPYFLCKRSFISSAVIVKKYFGATLIGVCENANYQHARIILNPKLRSLEPSDVLLFMASDSMDFSSSDREIVLTEDDEVLMARVDTQCRIAINGNANGESSGLISHFSFTQARHRNDVIVDDEPITSKEKFDDKFLPTGKTVYPAQNPLQAVSTDGLRDHIVVIDLHSLQEPPQDNESSRFIENARVECLYTLLQQACREDDRTIIYFSKSGLSPYICCTSLAQQIICVTGSILNDTLLQLCQLTESRAVILFSYWLKNNTWNDQQLAFLHQKVTHHLSTSNKFVPIICEVQHPRHLSLFPPTLNDNVEKHTGKHFAMQPKFFSGQIISETMLESALVQSYFNRYLMEIVRALVLGCEVDVNEPGALAEERGSTHISCASVPQILQASRTTSEPLSGDVEGGQGGDATTASSLSAFEIFTAVACKGRLQVGIFRPLEPEMLTHKLEGLRYMITNPPNNVVVTPLDNIYYLN